MKKYAKTTFFNNLELHVSDLKSNNPREYWKIIKMLVKDNNNNCQSIPPLQTNDNSVAISSLEKANALNNFFISVSTVDDSNVSLPAFISKIDSSIDCIDINEQEITDITRNLEIKKAAGPDEISHRMLKETSLTLCKPLCLLFNRSLREGMYPNKWKMANVMSLFKRGS